MDLYYTTTVPVAIECLHRHPLRISSQRKPYDGPVQYWYDVFKRRLESKALHALSGIVLPREVPKRNDYFSNQELEYAVENGKLPDGTKVLVFDGVARLIAYREYVQKENRGDGLDSTLFVKLYKPGFMTWFR